MKWTVNGFARSWLKFLGLCLGMSGGVACGSAPLSTAIVESPSSKVVTYGAPTQLTYSVEVDPALDVSTLTIYQKARCEVMSVQLFDRYEEKRRGDEVVERTLLGKRQQVESVKGHIDCAQSYGSRLLVMVDVGGSHFTLGETDPFGQVVARWSDLFKTAAMGIPEGPAQILIRPQKAQPSQVIGTISFQELARHQTRLLELIHQLGDILDRSVPEQPNPAAPAQLSQADSLRAYELFAQIQQMAPSDPRTSAIGTRFWELVYARKQMESNDKLVRNLDALSAAKETLKAMGNAAIPIYVQAAVTSGVLDARALEWASLRLMSAISTQQLTCVAGGGTTPPATWANGQDQLAWQYFQYGVGQGQGQRLAAMCTLFR